MLDAWEEASFSTVTNIDDGITYTEFYDLLELESTPKSVTKSIINAIEDWGTTAYHNSLCEALVKLNKPVLTTNFDKYLEGDSMKK